MTLDIQLQHNEEGIETNDKVDCTLTLTNNYPGEKINNLSLSLTAGSFPGDKAKLHPIGEVSVLPSSFSNINLEPGQQITKNTTLTTQNAEPGHLIIWIGTSFTMVMTESLEIPWTIRKD